MSTRLQVIVDDRELAGFRRQARNAGVSLSEWARAALRAAARADRRPSVAERLQAVERALACHHPTAAVKDMLAEIERGRGLR
jgi:hypothetical protein